jgi:hypothetical protein
MTFGPFKTCAFQRRLDQDDGIGPTTRLWHFVAVQTTDGAPRAT